PATATGTRITSTRAPPATKGDELTRGWALRGRARQPVRLCRAGGVELPSRLSEELGSRSCRVQGRPVRPRLDHGAERVDAGDDAGAERDLLPGQPFRVAGAVPALVMTSHD